MPWYKDGNISLFIIPQYIHLEDNSNNGASNTQSNDSSNMSKLHSKWKQQQQQHFKFKRGVDGFLGKFYPSHDKSITYSNLGFNLQCQDRFHF